MNTDTNPNAHGTTFFGMDFTSKIRIARIEGNFLDFFPYQSAIPIWPFECDNY